jgi:hypothetical protein
MPLHVLALLQGAARFDGDVVNTIVIIGVAAAVVLVFWASRPSVMARYSASAPPPEAKPADAAETEPSA